MLNQRDKELLLRDLSGRLRYGVRCQITIPLDRSQYIVYGTLIGIERDICKFDGVSIDALSSVSVDIVKPYLRPMWSMTEDEITEYKNFITNEEDDQLRFCNELVFYNSHHLDYRGLIPRGLALKASEDMYKNIKS